MTTETLALSDDFWSQMGTNVGAIVLYAIVGLVLTIVGFFAIDVTTPGNLRDMVRQGLPNSIVVTASGMVTMAFIVVIAIASSEGELAEGLLASTVYGLVGIAAQVISVRAVEVVTGINIGAVMRSPKFVPEALVVAAAHVGLGMVVAVSIS